MRSTEPARGQRGSSLIEAVVASALMGIGVIGGLTAWDTASMSAAKAVRIAWANCIVRSEMDAILSEQYADAYPVPSQFMVDGTVEVHVSQPRGAAEQLVTVKAYDPTSNHTLVLAQASALKASALAGAKTVDEPLLDVGQGCPNR
jgi:Tfp pilus assembly protein PilV